MKKKSPYTTTGVIIIVALVVGIYSWQQDLIPWLGSNNTENVTTIFPKTDQAGNPISGVFEGVTPCDSVPKPLPQIPDNAPCDHMVWKLALYQKANTNTPATYALSVRYGQSQPNTPKGHIGGGTILEFDGTWSVIYGTASKPDAAIYRLNTNSGKVSFIKVTDNILHLLNQNDTLRVGNGGWSYSLNRTGGLLPLSGNFTAYESDLIIGSEYGVFVGRTPCHAISEQLNISLPEDCSRIKWQITLYQDPNTLSPTTYKIRRIDVPDDTVGTLEGNWTIIQNSSGMTIYQLDFDEYNSVLFFAKGDNNMLFFLDEDMNLRVGNDLLSYTLSRDL